MNEQLYYTRPNIRIARGHAVPFANISSRMFDKRGHASLVFFGCKIIHKRSPHIRFKKK